MINLRLALRFRAFILSLTFLSFKVCDRDGLTQGPLHRYLCLRQVILGSADIILLDFGMSLPLVFIGKSAGISLRSETFYLVVENWTFESYI